jgi:uncharacterized membrane protein YcgQ (UPF0703/DUF1980 family)
MKLENSNQMELPSQGMTSPLPSTKFLLDTLLSIIHARTSSNVYWQNLNKLKKLYHKKQGLLLLKCLLVPKHVKRQKDGGKKTHRTLYPDTLLGRGLHPPTFANQTTLLPLSRNQTTHDSKKQEKRRSYNETRETETLKTATKKQLQRNLRN